MPEVTISLEGHAEELAVFGSRDQYLRQIRDAVGVKVLARHGEVRIEGDPDRIEQARRIFEGLRSIFRARKAIASSDVSELIDATLQAAASRSAGRARDSRRQPVGPAPFRRAGAVHEGPPRERAGLLHRSGRHGQDVPGRGDGRLAACAAAGSRRSCWCARPSRPASTSASCPGDLEAKINPYLRPLLDALHDLMDYDQIRRYMDNDLIEIAPLAYMRGRTLNDAVIILDEGQNATVPQMKMFLTRMGQNARIVVTGDITQVDLPIGDAGAGWPTRSSGSGRSPGVGDGVARPLGHRPPPPGAGDRRLLRSKRSRPRTAMGGLSPPRPSRSVSSSRQYNRPGVRAERCRPVHALFSHAPT